MDINNLKKNKRKLQKKIIKLKKYIDMYNLEIKNIENILLQECNHEWRLEETCCPNIKPDKICLKCDSIKYRF
jgi:hypothetical protein